MNDHAGRKRRGPRVNLPIILLIGVLPVGAVMADGPHDGVAVFKARCAKCHGESGKTDTAGARALKVRPLANDAELARMAPADIVKAIKSDPKHQGVGAVNGLEDTELEAAAVFVKKLAKEP